VDRAARGAVRAKTTGLAPRAARWMQKPSGSRPLRGPANLNLACAKSSIATRPA
jgi:hypothetical protein